MKNFELSSKISKNGRRHFKIILHEIYPDSCVDEINGTGNEYNDNGLTWIREYCENALPSISGMSLRCEFIDEERTFLNGHGETEIKDGLPLFENAVVIGTFEKGYITDIETDEGTKTVCIGEGTIDGLCYHNFCEKLEHDIENGNAPNGSVEILKTSDNPTIVYKYGYKEFGRIPMIFEYSGYALLGVRPADQTAQILELNNNKEDESMSPDEIKAMITQTIGEINSYSEEITRIKQECEQRIADVQAIVTEKENEINSLNEKISELEATIETINNEKVSLVESNESLSGEVNSLKVNLEDAQKKEKISELNSALENFTDEQKDYAKNEIESFKNDPLTSEINSIVQKIHAEIGKKYMEDVKSNSSNDDVEDIFSEIFEKSHEEDIDIF